MSRWCDRGLVRVVEADGRPAVSALTIAQLYAVRSGEYSAGEVLDDLWLRHSVADSLDELASGNLTQLDPDNIFADLFDD
jgi:hypothetical protein